MVGEEQAAVDLSKRLADQGIFVPAIRFPTVPKGKARLRVTVSAAHTADDISTFLNGLVGAASPPRSVHIGRPVQQLDRGGDAAPTRGPHQSNLRKGRVSIPEDCYFITTCTQNRNPLFATGQSSEVLINSLKWLRDQGRIRLLGFVIMPDHMHVAFALGAPSTATLADVMQAFKSFTSHALKRLNGVSEVWQDGYYDHRLRDRGDFEKRLMYMHDNPVRKGLVKFAGEYPFSTAHPDHQKDIDWAWLDGIRNGIEAGRGGDAAPTTEAS
jgi:REP element-mobilizing transposase RayT